MTPRPILFQAVVVAGPRPATTTPWRCPTERLSRPLAYPESGVSGAVPTTWTTATATVASAAEAVDACPEEAGVVTQVGFTGQPGSDKVVSRLVNALLKNTLFC